MAASTDNQDPPRGWSLRQVRDYVRDAIKADRAAWDLVPSLRVAIIARKYAEVVSGQASETIATAKLSVLWTDMLEAAGLLGGAS
jgi:hypothetical protein